MIRAPVLLLADVLHKRLRPKQHGFSYNVYYLCFALSELRSLKTRFLSLNKFNLLSFYEKDHGARNGSDLNVWIQDLLKSYNLIEANGDVILVTLPRVLGYVFNPVSFWFCLDHEGNLRAVLSEVSNTFGEHHSYISYHNDHRVIAPTDVLVSNKIFHVSPFMDVSGYYKFRFSLTSTKISVHVNHYDDEGLMLTTSVHGYPQALSSSNIVKSFFVYPLLTLKVISLIHFEAVRLILKGFRYFKKPEPPHREVTR